MREKTREQKRTDQNRTEEERTEADRFLKAEGSQKWKDPGELFEGLIMWWSADRGRIRDSLAGSVILLTTGSNSSSLSLYIDRIE